MCSSERRASTFQLRGLLVTRSHCKRLATITALVTLVTIHAVVDIPADVRVIEIGSVIPPVTPGALEDRVVTRVGVAGRAHAVRVAVIRVEPGVIERRPRPGRGRVAGVASRRETSGSVIRICGPVVISRVAAVTSGGQGGVVVIDVAHRARDSGSRVITSERERRVVVIKRCPGPVRCAMAHITSCREPCGRMRRRIGAVVVRLVARNTGRVRSGQAVIPVHVALTARHREVKARQRKSSGRMVECAATPIRRRVALVASLREACLRVVRIGGSLIVGQVTLYTGATCQLVIVVGVALGTGQ